MKRSIKALMALLLVLALFAGCTQKDDTPGEPVLPDETVTIQVNTFGIGTITLAEEGKDPEFDPDYPIQSIVNNVVPGTRLVLAAEAGEDYVFVRWEKDGAVFSTENPVTVTADANAEYVAVFGAVTGYEGNTITSVDDIKTMADVLPLVYHAIGYTETAYVYVFEFENTVYRAIANLTPELSQQLFALDWDDPDHNKKEYDLVAPLAVDKIENLSAAIPSQEELDNLVGKTGEDLLNDGWTANGFITDEMLFTMVHGPFEYEVVFDGEIKDAGNFNMDEDIKPFTVKSVRYHGIGDATNLDFPLE